MAITEFSGALVRRRIGFVRSLPSEAEEEFKRRGYDCYMLDRAMLEQPGTLDLTDSIIITQDPQKPSRIRRDLESYSSALDYDCRLYVRYAVDLTSQARVLDLIRELKLPPSGYDKSAAESFSNDWFDPATPPFAPLVHILREDEPWPRLANMVARNPAGRAPNADLKITFPQANSKPALTAARELLLQRAFSDCSKIELFPKTDGMSGVEAYEVFAHLGTNVVGSPAPYRCFVKIGPRVKVAREFQKYRTTALENIPFHLGPRLRLDRCVLGKSDGLITCDYVVGAETLRDSVRDGRAVHVIGNLFNQTLISWRRAARLEDRPLGEFLLQLLSDRTGVPEHRAELVQAYGSTKTLDELKALIGTCKSTPVLIGVVHGDLHATNVLVRMNDAVIIDLERIAMSQPLLLDAASLEGGLFVDGFVGDRRSPGAVLEAVKDLYSPAALGKDDHYCSPASRSAWYFDSVRQIRMQARQMEGQSNQYGWLLAAVLLKKACNPEILVDKSASAAGAEALTREQVRAMAYVVAENIVTGLSAAGAAVPQ